MSKQAFSLVETDHPSDEMDIRWVPVDDIRPDPDQPRKNFPREHFISLAMSIANEGLNQMPDITFDEGLTPWKIVNGECRWTSIHMFVKDFIKHDEDFVMGHLRRVRGVMEIRCVVRTFTSDEKRKVNQILDNAARKGFDPKEELEAIKALIDSGMEITDVAKALGRSEKVVEADLPILNLPKHLLGLYDKGDILKVVARELATFGTEKRMNKAWSQYASKVRGSEGQLARLEVYRKALEEKSASIFGFIDEVVPEKRKAAKSAYRKLTAAATHASNADLTDDKEYLMVALNSRELDRVEELSKTLAKISKHLHEGVLKVRASK
jgi:ParB family transcriptional regulator, chromosome partitioning protein